MKPRCSNGLGGSATVGGVLEGVAVAGLDVLPALAVSALPAQADLRPLAHG